MLIDRKAVTHKPELPILSEADILEQLPGLTFARTTEPPTVPETVSELLRRNGAATGA